MCQDTVAEPSSLAQPHRAIRGCCAYALLPVPAPSGATAPKLPEPHPRQLASVFAPLSGIYETLRAPQGQRECGSGTSRPGGQRLTLWLRQLAFYQAFTRQCQLKTQKNQNGKMLDARGCLPYQIQSKGCCAISPQGSLMARLWSPFFPACPLD